MSPIHFSKEKSTILKDEKNVMQRIHWKQSNNQRAPIPNNIYVNDGQELSLTAMIKTMLLETEEILERLAASNLSI